MAAIGDILSTPETGCKRYNDTHSFLTYIGTWAYDNSGGYNSYNRDRKTTTTVGDSLNFKFYGTKLIIRTYMNIDNSGYNIKIDGIDFGNIPTSMAKISFAVSYIVTNLENKIHDVKIICLDKSVFGSSTTRVSIDSIDTDGGLVHPALNSTPRAKVEDMEIGDIIPFIYSAGGTNSAGGISQLGTASGLEIPITSSATPNGLAYFIKVDKGLLICDRVVQHSIAWNTLNNAGYIDGLQINTNVDWIPKMTSATAPSPYVIKSSYNEASYQNYYIFDKTSSGWLVRGAITETSDAWFSIDVGNINNTFYSYSVFGNADNSTGDFPKRWNLYVSNEDTTTPVDWILIDTVNRYISGAYNILFQV